MTPTPPVKSEKLTSKSTWAGRAAVGLVESVPFQDMFHRYLDQSPGKTCLEIGCVPGKFLAYISRNFGYRAEGIDYVEGAAEITAATLQDNHIDDFEIHEEDFFDWKSEKKYDLVCSFGFIEHFRGQLNSQVIAKHVDLLNDGGKLFLEVPNFRFGQYVIHLILDRDKFKDHNLKTMKLSYFRKIARDHGLRIQYLGYAGGFFDYWTSDKPRNILESTFIGLLNWLKKKSGDGRALRRLDNRFLSPVVIFIANK